MKKTRFITVEENLTNIDRKLNYIYEMFNENDEAEVFGYAVTTSGPDDTAYVCCTIKVVSTYE